MVRFSALADLLVLGPYLAFSARNERNPYFRAGMILVGVGTALYGLQRLRQADDEQPPPPMAGLSSLACACRLPYGARVR
jgi:hypothetical protein